MFLFLYVVWLYVSSKFCVFLGCVLLSAGGTWYGVDIMKEDVVDNFDSFVWEPSIMKVNALTAASEAACLILSVDETIKHAKSQQDLPPGGIPGTMPGGMPGRGRGRPM